MGTLYEHIISKFFSLFFIKVLNLFLALLLNSFATDSLRKTKDTKKDKMKQGWDKLKNLFKSKPADIQPSRSKNPSIGDIVDELTRRRNGTYDGKVEVCS